jgi:hypothetical protein
MACRHSFQYIWIDNVYIDKSSKTELSEAINSMYKWYRNAERCYVYLSDFDFDTYDNRPTNGPTFTREHVAKLQNCKWFTRGWTLQELLAPPQVLFYDRNWLYFGKLDELTLGVSSVTRIPEALLDGKTRLFDYTAAQKMSWAATRTTTREEDMAYCLFGLFEINLPLFTAKARAEPSFASRRPSFKRVTTSHCLPGRAKTGPITAALWLDLRRYSSMPGMSSIYHPSLIIQNS